MKRLLTHLGLRFFLLFSCIFLSSFFISLSAQEFVKGGANGFEWRLIGHVFFDGGYFFNDTTDLGSSFQVNDIRLGTQIRFLEHWEAKIELGYGDSKISMKDIFLTYKFGEQAVRVGYQYEPFGNSRVGTTNFRFMTNAASDKALGNSRKLGVGYSYNHQWFNFMGGIYSDGDVQKSKSLDQGYSLAAKLIGRPLLKDKKLVHLSVAPRFSSGQETITFNAGIPTDLLTKDDNSYVEAKVDQVINQWKLDLEMILLYNKWYFQGQYFLAHLNRFQAGNYNGKGWYGQIGYMILGAKHNYNAATGMIVNPAPKSLEVLCRYNMIDLNDAGIRGGRLTDISLGMNYFINKYVAAKINYTHMMVGNSSPKGGDDFDLIQARLQFSF